MLGPMMNLARAPEAGRNWEGAVYKSFRYLDTETQQGFGGDPFLSGVGASLTVKGIQSVGVIATAKHLWVS